MMRIFPAGPPRRSSCHYSLIEIIIVLSMIVLLTSIVLPRTGGMPRAHRLDVVKERFDSSFALASNLAVSTGKEIVLQVDLDKSVIRFKDTDHELLEDLGDFEIDDLKPVNENLADGNVVEYRFYPSGESDGQEVQLLFDEETPFSVKADPIHSKAIITVRSSDE